jgi:hypothetical protein
VIFLYPRHDCGLPPGSFELVEKSFLLLEDTLAALFAPNDSVHGKTSLIS